MKIVRSLLIPLFIIILCKCTDDDFSVWLYSPDYGGSIHTGSVVNLTSGELILCSSLDSSSHTFQVKYNTLYDKDSAIADLVLKSKKCLIIKYQNDTMVYHSIPDLGMNERYTEVFNLLSRNSFSYKDNHQFFQIDFDTTYFDYGFRKSTITETMHNDYQSLGSWDLKIVNNSLILFNTIPYVPTQKSFLITNISKDSIAALIIEVPINKYDDFTKAVSKNKLIDFSYEQAVFKRMK